MTLSVLREPVERTLSHLRHHRKMNPEARDASLETDLRRRVPAGLLREPHGEDVLAHRGRDRGVRCERDTWAMVLRIEFTPERLERAKQQVGAARRPRSPGPLRRLLRRAASHASDGSSANRSTRTAHPRSSPEACGLASRPTTRSTSSCTSTRARSTADRDPQRATDAGPTGPVGPAGRSARSADPRPRPGCARATELSIPTPNGTAPIARSVPTRTTNALPTMPTRSPFARCSTTGAGAGGTRAGCAGRAP